MPKLNVAIVGAGPGGLATIIHFQRIPDVQLSVFDGAKELREVGAVSVPATYLLASLLMKGHLPKRKHLATPTAPRRC